MSPLNSRILPGLLSLLGACATAAIISAQQASTPAGTWLRGDLHTHDDHSSDGSQPRQRNKDKAKGNVTAADQIGQATRMGLQFLPLTDHRTYDQQYDPLWESSSLLLIPGEEANGSPHATALGGADSIVQGAARPDRPGFMRVQQSVWDAHSQDAIWTVVHPDDGETNAVGTPNDLANVQGVNLIEFWNRASNVEKEIDYSENRWNAGFRFGVAGAGDSHFRERWGSGGSPGNPTTNVLAAAYNERGVLDGLRAGHTSLSNSPTGPFVTLTTDLKGGGNAAMGGDEVFVPAGSRGHLSISARRAAGMRVLLYRKPGRSAGPMKTFVPARDDETFAVDITAGDQPDWYRVEVRGPSAELTAAVSPLFISPAPVEAAPETPVPADRGEEDSALQAAGARGEFSGFPDVATKGGVVHVVAEEHGAATSIVVYRRRDAKRVWSDAGRPLSGAGLARFPRVAARGNDVWVAWQEDAKQVPHRPEIRLRHSADGGATWQAAQTVRALAGDDPDPLWTGTADGGAGTNPDDWQIMIAARNTTGAWATPVELGAADLADRHPDVQFSATGDLVVAWESKELRSSGANLSVRAAVSTDGGATFSTPIVPAPDAQAMSQRPRLGMDTDGSVRAVWYDSRSADWRWRVMTAVYRKSKGWDAGTLLNGRGINTWPATAGGFIAFASTRNATRLQRDPTQQIFLLPPK